MMPEAKKVDTNEFELPETVFIRDIENRVFQGIVLQCLAEIEGISLTEGTLIDNILGRGAPEGVKGIFAEQDSKHRSVKIRIEVNVCYGVSIPEKAEEIQTRVSDEITRLTGLHVASVHVVFKNIMPGDPHKRFQGAMSGTFNIAPISSVKGEEDYSDEF